MTLSESQTIALLEVLRILRHNESRFARKKIYESYLDRKFENLESLDLETIHYVEKLNGDFDEIGFLVEEFQIKEQLFPLYSDTIRRIWIILENYLQKEQNKRSKKDPASKQFSYYFTNLAQEAKKYRDKNNLPEPGITDLRNT
ncbi:MULTISPECIES: hypothetical protein [Nitrosopumilus]|uniref:hypothetical protein n=1 Tax=Nitrosopumilus TaxID=338191 RepID=UPI001E2F5361|nr:MULTISPECIES: hypothetical protein [Nitrosopumilus]